MGLDDTAGAAARSPLAVRLEQLLGMPVSEPAPLLGGASRETWSLRAGGRDLVARADPEGAPRTGAMRREAQLMRVANAAGVPVPEVVAADDDLLVMAFVAGETTPRRILHDDDLSDARERLTRDCATALARLHGAPAVSVPDLPVEPDPLAALRDLLDRLGEPHPAIELGLARLEACRPAPTGHGLVHGDFRLGNLMVGHRGLAAVLDWELAHVGDTAADLGWLCVRSWRFGGSHPVAGVGDRDALLTAYAEAGGAAVDLPTLLWWEALGTARWAVICVQQAATHLSGARRSVELAAIGRRICAVELDLLDLVGVPADAAAAAPVTESVPAGPHDRPTATELLEAVREWAAGLPLTGPDAYLRAVADRALALVERELSWGAVLAARHDDRLRSLGVGSDAALAAAIRSGRDDPAMASAVRDAIEDKLRVADPRRLVGRPDPTETVSLAARER